MAGPIQDGPSPDRFRVAREKLRWRCDPARFGFVTTDQIESCPINIIGQPRAQEALELGLRERGDGYNIFVSGEVGCGRSTVVRRMLAEHDRSGEPPGDVAYVHNFREPDEPTRIDLRTGEGKHLRRHMDELIESLHRDVPRLFESEPYRKRKVTEVERASAEQKARLKEFERRVQTQGFALAQVQMGPFIRSQLVPVVAGNPVDMDQLESLVEENKFKRTDLDELKQRETALRTELEGLSREIRRLDRGLRERLRELDRELARPLVEEATGEIRAAFPGDALAAHLDMLAADILDHLDEFRGEEPSEPPPAPGGPAGPAPAEPARRYLVNVVVDNSNTTGRPVIWETAPNYRNLFGTLERVRTDSGEWQTDHTRIKGGSLLRANGGFLVLDALDVLVEPGVWSALKRTLRHRKLEFQSFDPFFLIAGVSLKPEPCPVDVKVVMIGTHQIYHLLYALDEDFKKIFKIRADFALETPRVDDEIDNYACLIHKRCTDDRLPPFHREAVAAVVEHGARLAGDQEKLTTRFARITDLIREAGYWALRANAPHVTAEHVDRALEKHDHRVDRIEENLRERIADGTVLLDLEGEKVGQVNGLAVLDAGDHVFGHPMRVTASTAMGRAGIIAIDREAEMSGRLHTKGVLILAGFLRERFAQDKPLALTASICFEQSYGGVDGDSASSTELYALLSSLAGVPIRQGVAVTGSVNQRGEIQPIGGVNEKIEGYFKLCRLRGLDGRQGVMIPSRNVKHLMLRPELLRAVDEGRFHVWAVSTIEDGLEVLTGRPAGGRDAEGRYPADSILGRVDARLARLAEEVNRFGLADAGPAG